MAENRFEFVARMYTGARRFPRWFGRFLDGRKVPGGPYKITQIVIGGVCLLLTISTYTLGWWRTGSPLLDLIFGGSVITGTFWVSGKIPQTKRNPLALVQSAWRATAAPRHGKYRGRPVTPRRPHSTASSRRVPPPRLDVSVPRAPRTGPPAPTAPPVTPSHSPQTGLARLLAQADHD